MAQIIADEKQGKKLRVCVCPDIKEQQSLMISAQQTEEALVLSQGLSLVVPGKMDLRNCIML